GRPGPGRPSPPRPARSATRRAPRSLSVASWRSPPLCSHRTWPRVDAGHEDLRTKPAFCASNVWLCAWPAGSLVEVNAPGLCPRHDPLDNDPDEGALPVQLRVGSGSGDDGPVAGGIYGAVRL